MQSHEEKRHFQEEKQGRDSTGNQEIPAWHAMYAYKKELRSKQELEHEKIECFIPMCYSLRQRQGRTERRLLPAISNLIFVHTTKNVLNAFKANRPYLQYITRKAGKQREVIVIPDSQMKDFIKVAEKYEEDLIFYKPEEICLEKGKRVRVHGGKFDGVEGVLLKLKGKRNRRIVIKIPGIVAVAAAYIEPEFIEVIETNKNT